ncbi:hypothetical protein BC939DRAFT_532697 [Gamsiella multidivaricata]|uniref:uncharacterized protein n=1 Tax=Gamsiella multidivaricata TaxID=101098 RepID=UPI00221FC776|nr:uncharacterized protein BC939DRAFT_532697 [Gamsiella multidivaricata]KAI7817521.1 hypothetical protein BC939DRAFT_532697 [Gamsiella multidivaricata]
MAQSTVLVALRAPMVLTSHFARHLSPQLSASSLHGLRLGVVGIYEVLCTAEPDYFDINEAAGRPFTDIANVARTNKRTTVRIIVRNKYDERKRDRSSRSDASKWTTEFEASGLTTRAVQNQVQNQVQTMAAQVELKEVEIKRLRLEKRSKEAPVWRHGPPTAATRSVLLEQNKQGSKISSEGYGDEDASGTEDAVATWDCPTAEDKAQRLEISDRQKFNSKNKNKLIVFAGTDYGLRTTNSVPWLY